MQLSSLSSPQLSYRYLEEYLRQLDQYKNYRIQSLPVRYFSLETTSTFEDSTAFWTSPHCKYTLYDLTPLIYATPFAATTTEMQYGAILYFTGVLHIATLKPKINDLIFFFSPLNSTGVRVTNMRVTPHTIEDKTIYEIDVEPANIQYEHIKNLNIQNHYVFFANQYVTLDVYENIINLLQTLESIASEIESHFDSTFELYFFTYGDQYNEQTIVAASQYYNRIIYDCLEFYTKGFSFPLLSTLPRPYGIFNYSNDIDKSGNTIDLTGLQPQESFLAIFEQLRGYLYGNNS